MALFNEIYMKIEVFSSSEPNFTSALIAKLAVRLTFFIPPWGTWLFFFIQIHYSIKVLEDLLVTSQTWNSHHVVISLIPINSQSCFKNNLSTLHHNHNRIKIGCVQYVLHMLMNIEIISLNIYSYCLHIPFCRLPCNKLYHLLKLT